MTFWLIAVVALLACAVQVWSIRMTRHLELMLVERLNGLNQTYMLGYDTLTATVNRLEKRLKAVEDEIL